MATTLSMIRRYVPEFADNRDKEKDEQIVVKLKSVSVRIRQQHIRKFLKMKGEDITEQMMSDAGSKEIEDILFANVVGFENFNVETVDDKGEMVIVPMTIKHLWDLGEFALCVELFTNILNNSQLTKDQEKNSVSQSGNTRALTEGQVVEAEVVDGVH